MSTQEQIVREALFTSRLAQAKYQRALAAFEDIMAVARAARDLDMVLEDGVRNLTGNGPPDKAGINAAVLAFRAALAAYRSAQDEGSAE